MPVYLNVGLPSAALPVPVTLSSHLTCGPAIWSNRNTDPLSAPVARFTSNRNFESWIITGSEPAIVPENTWSPVLTNVPF